MHHHKGTDTPRFQKTIMQKLMRKGDIINIGRRKAGGEGGEGEHTHSKGEIKMEIKKEK